MKIAVGGSAANPPHKGHKALVEAVVATNAFDHVRWTVSGDRPDKPGMIASETRWDMGKKLFGPCKNPVVFYEPEEAVPTRDVLARLNKCYPEAEIIWYCGADHFVPRERFGGKCDVLGFWHDGERIFRNQQFLIIPRKGVDMNTLQLPYNYSILDVEIPEISSTDIRKRVAQGLCVKQFVGKEVAEYIRQNGLYF